MIPEPVNHKTYILRVWHVEHDRQLSLVASLEDCSGEGNSPPQRRAFPSIRALCEFLITSTDQSPFSPLSETESGEATVE